MSTNKSLLACLFTLSLSPIAVSAAKAQTMQPSHPSQPLAVTHDNLQLLMPAESELQGFLRLKLTKFEPSKDITGVESDRIELNQDVTQWFPGRAPTPTESGAISLIGRRYVSANNLYWITVEISLRETPEAAAKEVGNFLRSAQAAYTPGTLSGAPRIGDESYFTGENSLLFRCGRMMVYINGSLTWAASHRADNSQLPVTPFPALALEAIAYQTLLRASQEFELTGVSVQQASIVLNGHVLPKNGSLVAGRTYVPVTEFARAMGLTSRWDTKTGALTLSGSGHKTVTLTAGSTQATVGGAKAAALSVPVLKQAGEPVMTLDDLLAVTGGHITGRSGGAVQIKT